MKQALIYILLGLLILFVFFGIRASEYTRKSENQLDVGGGPGYFYSIVYYAIAIGIFFQMKHLIYGKKGGEDSF